METRRGCWLSWNWIWLLRPTVYMIIKPRSSIKAVCALTSELPSRSRLDNIFFLWLWDVNFCWPEDVNFEDTKNEEVSGELCSPVWRARLLTRSSASVGRLHVVFIPHWLAHWILTLYSNLALSLVQETYENIPGQSKITFLLQAIRNTTAAEEVTL